MMKTKLSADGVIAKYDVTKLLIGAAVLLIAVVGAAIFWLGPSHTTVFGYFSGQTPQQEATSAAGAAEAVFLPLVSGGGGAAQQRPELTAAEITTGTPGTTGQTIVAIAVMTALAIFVFAFMVWRYKP